MIFKAHWIEILNELDVKTRLAVYGAVLDYAITGKVVQLEPLARMAFLFIKSDIDRRVRRQNMASMRRAKRHEDLERANQSKPQAEEGTESQPQDKLSQTSQEARETLSHDIQEQGISPGQEQESLIDDREHRGNTCDKPPVVYENGQARFAHIF